MYGNTNQTNHVNDAATSTSFPKATASCRVQFTAGRSDAVLCGLRALSSANEAHTTRVSVS